MKRNNRRIFNQMLKMVPKMEYYQTDITEHDKNTLEDYEGRFLWSWDEMSTHFIKLDFAPDADLEQEREKLREFINAINWNKQGRTHKWFYGNTHTGQFTETKNPLRALDEVLDRFLARRCLA